MTQSLDAISREQCVTVTQSADAISEADRVTECGCTRCRQQRTRERRARQVGLCHHCGALVQCNTRGTLRRHRRATLERGRVTHRVCPGTATDGTCDGAEVIGTGAIVPMPAPVGW